MQNPLHTKGKTRTSLVINAARPVVYHACVDPGMIVLWRVPNSMTGHVHESEDPAFAGEMKITTSFVDVGVNTEITILCEDIPAGIKPADNEQGCRESLQKLALLLN